MGRYLGFVADSVAKGSSFDDLTAGGTTTVPAPVRALPVTTATVDPGRRTRERADEIRGGRGTVAPTVTQHAPTVSFSCRAYPEVVAPLLYMALGKTTRTGSSAPYTDSIEPVADSATYLPGAHLAVERDGLFQQIGGWKPSNVTLSLPLEEDGTVEADGTGLVLTRPASPTWPKSFTYLGSPEWVLQLRDAMLYENDSPTPVDCLRGATLAISDIQREPDWCAGKNREFRTVGGDDYPPIWHPDRIRVAPRRQITGTLEFTGVDGTREAQADVLAAQKLVLEIEARSLGGSPAATELLRVTIYNGAWTGGGPADLSRDDDINTSMEFGAFVDATGKDILVEYLNDKTTSPVLVPSV